MCKVERIYLIFMVVHRLFSVTTSVPLTIINDPVVEEVIDDEEVEDDDDDDSTTHTLERLSSAATCLVAGIEYTHGQQIYRQDQCEFCLCLDGEMFCWWQDCPPTLEGPCKERGPFSPCLNGGGGGGGNALKSSSTIGQIKLSTTNKQPSSATTAMKATASTTRTNSNNDNNNNNNRGTSILLETSTQQQQSSQALNEDAATTSTESGDDDAEESSGTASSTAFMRSAPTTSSTTTTPKVCIVMGREYQIGDHLPHDTGNCVECVCGADAQISCSPHQCAPLDEDIVYRPPGPRQPEVF